MMLSMNLRLSGWCGAFFAATSSSSTATQSAGLLIMSATATRTLIRNPSLNNARPTTTRGRSAKSASTTSARRTLSTCTSVSMTVAPGDLF
uniref:RxLR effector protein n=1 Tax=Phytophthora fragariae TaxID=53985 RepID=A0A6A3DNH7_9STRA|nr:hypothetical protein PF009_g27223 [Phytophthora fragariae]